MRRPILNNSIPGDAVYEPFLGSGTTLIAAESTGRFCLAMELDPLYVDVAIRRWQTFSGKEAILSGSGRTFAQVAEERTAGPPNGGETPPPGTAAPTQTANSLGAPEAGPHLPRGTRFPLADDQAATSSGMPDARDRPVPTTQAPVAPDHGGA
jgi:hypothetical protein